MPVADSAVVELGCGAAAILVEFAPRQPRRLGGYRIPSAMAELARRTTRHLPSIEIVELTGDDLPFSPWEFDVTFTVTVVRHNPTRRPRTPSESSA
jgi:hypothetical protein